MAAQALLPPPRPVWLSPRLSALDARHMQFSWISLVLVMVADLHIMSVSAGWIPDLAWRA